MLEKKSLNHAFHVKDEYKTPSCLINFLLPYIRSYITSIEFTNHIVIKPEEFTILCPFDHEESQYVQILKKQGYNVIFSHISDGEDFFDIVKKVHFDICISNPPFSKKKAVFQTLIDMKKPFVLLMNLMAINYQEIGELFYKAGTDIQFIIPDKKVSFDGKTSSFCSGYVCYKFIEQTQFVHLDNNNSGSFFTV